MVAIYIKEIVINNQKKPKSYEQSIFISIYSFCFIRRIIVDFLIYIYIFILSEKILSLPFYSSSLCVQYSSRKNHSVCMSRCKLFLSFFPVVLLFILSLCAYSFYCFFRFPLDTCNNFFSSQSTHAQHIPLYFITVTQLIMS